MLQMTLVSMLKLFPHCEVVLGVCGNNNIVYLRCFPTFERFMF